MRFIMNEIKEKKKLTDLVIQATGCGEPGDNSLLLEEIKKNYPLVTADILITLCERNANEDGVFEPSVILNMSFHLDNCDLGIHTPSLLYEHFYDCVLYHEPNPDKYRQELINRFEQLFPNMIRDYRVAKNIQKYLGIKCSSRRKPYY